MILINSYLTFNGNCREAMTFYKQCLGGKLTFQTLGKSPLADRMPMKMKDCILHSTLTKGAFTIMGTDMVPQSGLIKGNAISLMLHCNSESQIKNYYEKLSSGGNPSQPLENTFWDVLFGALTDKFGNHWLLNYSKNQNHKSKKILK